MQLAKALSSQTPDQIPIYCSLQKSFGNNQSQAGIRYFISFPKAVM